MSDRAAPGALQRLLPDLRGAARLAVDATLGVTTLVEAMHAGIASLPWVPAPARTRGITGLVYRTVRRTTRVAGHGLETAFALLEGPASRTTGFGSEPEPDGDASWRGSGTGRDTLRSVLNGMIGDHLAATANPLALAMTLRHRGRALQLDRTALRAALPLSTGRVLVLLHGLCMNDRQWHRDGHDHGAELARDGGYTPVHLRYNSGLPVHVNGASFAASMASLLAEWPVPIERVVLLAHSMGGLVARSAIHQGLAAGQAWASRVDDVVFLGTPHHGAPLERAGHMIDLLLDAAPYAAPLARVGRIRSAGIVDLRRGRITADARPVPLSDGPRWHSVAARAGNGRGRPRVIGDGLVPVDSALGRHPDPARHLQFASERLAVFDDMHHMALLARPEVTRMLTRWLC